MNSYENPIYDNKYISFIEGNSLDKCYVDKWLVIDIKK